MLANTALRSGHEIAYCYDSNHDRVGQTFLGVPIFSDDKLNECECAGLVAIGSNSLRMHYDQRFPNLEWSKLVDPSAIIAQDVHIGVGSVVVAGGIINPNTTIGRHCIINTAASVDHDCRLSDYVHVAPGARVGGGVTVGEATLVGMGSTIVSGISIGKNCTIGAGSVVTSDIPDNSRAVGNPARF